MFLIGKKKVTKTLHFKSNANQVNLLENGFVLKYFQPVIGTLMIMTLSIYSELLDSI